MHVTGLDRFTTTCRFTPDLIDPQIFLEAHCKGLSVCAGHWTITQAREVAALILNTCDSAEQALAAATLRAALEKAGQQQLAI